MDKRITVRLAKPEEAGTILKWMIANSQRNNFDMDAVMYPSTMVLCAENGMPRVFMPMQAVFVLDSLGPDPAIGHCEQVVALAELLQAAKSLARGMKVGELYFIGSDPEVNKQAELRGFKRVELPVYRLKVNNAIS